MVRTSELTDMHSIHKRPAVSAERLKQISAGALGLLTALLFGLHVARYYFLGDDCFISFRYAENLVKGHGLVFNPGERVEGYTNFLWVLLMAGAMKFSVRPEIFSNALGIASAVVILAALVHKGAKSRGWTDPLIWVAPLCLAVHRSFCAWSTGGLAT